MHKPREKWLVLTGGDECPCAVKINLETGTRTAKMCFYHQKLKRRWEEWAERPPAEEKAPDSEPLPFDTPPPDELPG